MRAQVAMIIALLISPSICSANPSLNRWETADLIVEGMIIETKTSTSTLQVERVLKSDTISIDSAYSKGSVAGLFIEVPSSTIPAAVTHLVFLEETPTGYRIIYTEKIGEQVQTMYNVETVGLLALILVSASTLLLDRKKGYS